VHRSSREVTVFQISHLQIIGQSPMPLTEP
jgi:hypothetical protein